jgi:hypothetical protein
MNLGRMTFSSTLVKFELAEKLTSCLMEHQDESQTGVSESKNFHGIFRGNFSFSATISGHLVSQRFLQKSQATANVNNQAVILKGQRTLRILSPPLPLPPLWRIVLDGIQNGASSQRLPTFTSNGCQLSTTTAANFQLQRLPTFNSVQCGTKVFRNKISSKKLTTKGKHAD